MAEIDEDRDGEIPRKRVSELIAKVGRDPKTCSSQISAFCLENSRAGLHQPTPDACSVDSDPEETFGGRVLTWKRDTKGRRSRSRGKGRRRDEKPGRGMEHDTRISGPSTANLAEVLASFGFVFEGTGAATKPSVAEAFAMLRLHAQPAETRVAGETAKT